LKIPVCTKSGDIIEPMVKSQLKDEAKQVVSAAREGKLKFTPEAGHFTWFNYLEI
jgi:valyl-tRNA synthetase